MNIFDELSDVYQAGLHEHPIFWSELNRVPVGEVIRYTEFLVGSTRLVEGNDWFTLCNIVALHRGGCELSRKQIQRCAMTVIRWWSEISVRQELL